MQRVTFLVLVLMFTLAILASRSPRLVSARPDILFDIPVPAANTPGSDDFNAETLDPKWSWVREVPGNWSLTARSGYLRLISQFGDVYGTSNNATNMLFQPASGDTLDIRTKVESPLNARSMGGIHIYQDDNNYVRLGLTGAPGILFGREIAGSPADQEIIVDGSSYYLRLTKSGQTFNGYYSADGSTWLAVGQPIIANFTTFRVGLAAYNSMASSEEVRYDFDFFQVSTDIQSVAGIITTVAGNGQGGFSGDGGPATQATFSNPDVLTVGPDGSLYIADQGNHRVRRVGLDGVITTVAGNGQPGFSGDGGPATQASLNIPIGLAFGPDGSLYIGDRDNNRVRRVAPDGIMTTVAGDGQLASSGDGGPATQASLGWPHGVVVGSDGSLYIAERSTHKIRRVGTDGVITTVAGNGQAGFSGDGGLATQASLNTPELMALGPDDSLYFNDQGNQRVRRIAPDGTISTVAGGGSPADGVGDGGPATEASLPYPHGVAVGSDGSVYIADRFQHRVRRVRPDGTITTYAGNGQPGYSGDGGPATQAQLNWPVGLALGSDGSLYIGEHDNNRVRRVSGSGATTSTIGGRVTERDGNGLGAVTLTAGSAQSGVTSANGSYSISGLAQGTYQIVPSRSGYLFVPRSRTISVPSDTDSINFHAEAVANTPVLVVNYTLGRAGSSFALTCANFTPNVTLTVAVNDRVLGSVRTDASGGCDLALSTNDADDGQYVVTVSVSPGVSRANTATTVTVENARAATTFTLNANAPLRQPESDVASLSVPAGIARHLVYLPLTVR